MTFQWVFPLKIKQWPGWCKVQFCHIEENGNEESDNDKNDNEGSDNEENDNDESDNEQSDYEDDDNNNDTEEHNLHNEGINVATPSSDCIVLGPARKKMKLCNRDDLVSAQTPKKVIKTYKTTFKPINPN